MGDNAPMTDRPMEPADREADKDLEHLDTADPADAPQIAEDLADRLAGELEGAPGSHTSRPEGTS
jgi:hypothetical protein